MQPKVVGGLGSEQPSQASGADSPDHESVLEQRLRQGQTDMDDAIALLRSLPLADLPPAIVFDPRWGEGAR